MLSFARNFGQHAAVMAGFEASRGEWIVTLDADLQNPPEEIPKIVAAFREGYDLVNTYREGRQDTSFRRYASRLTNAMVRRFSGISLSDFGCMLRGYHRSVVAPMVERKEYRTFIPALAMLHSRRPTEVSVQHSARERGASNYSLLKLFSLQLDLVTSFSIAPLRMLFMLGWIIALPGDRVRRLPDDRAVCRRARSGRRGGVFTLFAILFFFVGAQFLAFGLLGEYIGRIYQEVRNRPTYLLRNEESRRPHRRKVTMQKRVAAALLALFVVAYLAPLGIRPLYETDEFRYAEIPREMIASGDWVVPRLDGMRYFEKPALGYWLTASSMVLFGQNPFGVRLPVALSAGVTALALFLLVRRFSFAKGTEGNARGVGAAAAAAGILLTSSMFYMLGCYSTLDMPLTMFLTVAAVLFYFAFETENPRRKALCLLFFGVADRVRVPDEGVSGLRFSVRGGRAVHALGAADRKAPAAGVAAAADDGAGRAALVPNDPSARTGFLAAVLLGAALAPVLERARAACAAALVLHPVDRRRHPAVDGARAGGDHRPRKGKTQGPADPFRAVLAGVPVPLLLPLQRQAAHVHPALFPAAGAAGRRGTAPVFRPGTRQGVRRRRVGRHSAARRGHGGDRSRQRERRRDSGRAAREGPAIPLPAGRTMEMAAPHLGAGRLVRVMVLGGAGRALRCTGWRCCARGRAFSWWRKTA